MSTVQTCPDSHKCRNGAVCKEDEVNEGSYYCDCSVIESRKEEVSVFAGLSCEHEATVYCNPTNTVSASSFCTNGGTCVEDEDETGVHYGCVCLDDYKGEHCQYTKDQSIPGDWPSPPALSDGNARQSTGGSPNTTAVVASVVSVVVVALLVFVGVVVWRRRQREPHMVDKSGNNNLQLDADGTTLRDADPAAVKATAASKQKHRTTLAAGDDDEIEAVDII